LGLGRPDIGVGGDESLFGRANVRSMLEQCRGQAGGDDRRQALRRLVECPTSDDLARVTPGQQAQRVFGASNLALDVPERCAGRVEEILGLRYIEPGGRPEVSLRPGELKALLASLNGVAGNLELEVEGAEPKVRGADVGDHRNKYGAPYLLAREELGAGRFREAADPAPDIDFPGHVE